MWHFHPISVTLIHEKVWVTDPNHSDRRSTWPQQRKQHQRSVARRQQLQQLHQRSVARRQQLRRQLQSVARRQQLRRLLQRSARRQQLRKLLQRSAARRQLLQLLQRSAAARRQQLRSNYQLKKPATLCGGFFYADFIRAHSHYEKTLLSGKRFQLILLDRDWISGQENANAHLQRGQVLQRLSPSNP